jgi:hypothetical protein
MATTLQSRLTICSSLVLSRTITGLSFGALRSRKNVNSSVGYLSRTRLGRQITLQDLVDKQTLCANSAAPSRRRQSIWWLHAHILSRFGQRWIGVSVGMPPSLDFGTLKVRWRSVLQEGNPSKEETAARLQKMIYTWSDVFADMITRRCLHWRSSKSSSLTTNNGSSPGVKCLLRLRPLPSRLVTSSFL